MSEPRDAVATMGDLLPADVGGRDAVHVAVISARAGQNLFPGQHVGLRPGEGEREAWPIDKLIGIVDPFITGKVGAGARFWLYLYPRTITGLHHVWAHPDIPDASRPANGAAPATVDVGALALLTAARANSEAWLRAFCRGSAGLCYESVIARVLENEREAGVVDLEDDEDASLHFSGKDAHGEIPPEFWVHAATVLGRPIMGPKAKWFSCSC